MNLITQPMESKICGHCCVSMVSGVELKEVIKTIGHENGTFGVDLIKCLNLLGVKTAKKLAYPLKENNLPQTAILRIKFNHTRSGHWVVLHKGNIYDPSFHYDFIEYNHYKEEFLRNEARFISYLEVQ